MPSVVNIKEKFTKFEGHWQPRIIGELNENHVKIAKIEGEFMWHKHDDEDEMFLVIEGRFLMKLRDGDQWLETGDMIVIPKGVEHMPVAEEECWIMMIEPKTTVNTGDAGGEKTYEPEWV